MNKNLIPEIKSNLEQLDLESLEDVLFFVQVRLAQRKADMKPFITAQEWERLKPWQRKAIYWRIRWYVFLNGPRALIHV